MFGTLLLKEMHETIISYRFLIALIICLTLIPLGMYISFSEYELRLSDYRESMRLYRDKYEHVDSPGFIAEGYRPPSPLSIFSNGLENYIPNKIVISREDQYTVENDRGLSNPRAQITGSFDFIFIVGTVLSMLAFMFTFSAISGEKELGTLRLILANAVPRHIFILSKLIGNFIMFLLPFIIGTLTGIIMLLILGSNIVFDASSATGILFILLISCIFLFVMFTLGIWISTLSGNSVTVLVSLLLVWVVLSLVIPKTSPLIAQAMYQVKSEEVKNTEIENIKRDLRQEKETRLRELLEKFISSRGHNPNGFQLWGNELSSEITAEYDESAEKAQIEQEYEERTSTMVRSLEMQYRNAQKRQDGITNIISRISPVGCYMNVVTEIAGTGMLEIDNIHEQAQQYYAEVKQNIYDKFIRRWYGLTGGMTIMADEPVDGQSPDIKLPVPELNEYKHIPVEKAIVMSFTDLFLLVIYSILFFACGYSSFIRYDVR